MKGVRISDEAKEEVIKMYQLGKPFKEIQSATGCSPASISGILAARAEEDPDLNEVHQIVAYLGGHGKTPATLLRAIVIDEQIKASGATLDDVVAVLPLAKKYGKELAQHIQRADSYAQLEMESGYTHPQLVAEHQRLASEIEVSKKEASSLESKLVGLNDQVQDLTSRLAHLKDLEGVHASLKKIGRSPTEAAKVVAKCEWFLGKGLSEAIMDALVAEMAKQEFQGLEGPKRIGELVHQYGDLEKAVTEETRALDTLETEKRKLTSDRIILTEKVAALARRCQDLELRERKSRQDLETVEAGFSGRRTELESKLGTIEHDIKSASARLQGVQSQLLATEKQLAMGREEVTGINSQKADAQSALVSLESRKQSLSQDYLSTVQTVAGLKQDLVRLKGERDEFVTEYNKTAKVYMDSIGKLREEVAALRKTKSELDDAIAKCANILDEIQGNYVKDERLLALVSLLTGEESWLKPAQVLEPIVAALEATKKYIERHPREIPGSGALLISLGSLIDTMVGILRFGNR